MKTIQVGDVVGDYKVIDTAGSGGMGTVYRIEHVITKRIEAMKLLPPSSSSDPDQLRRFQREIELQARLHHPNIVALYNAVRNGDSIALVMEFVEGDCLQRRVDAGPLPVEAAVDFATQVLRALACAHEAGVIHRDVSPLNIIITPDLVAKLTDFGLALGTNDVRLSASGVPLGSPWYMSPEQVKGVHELDGRTDLYAMGAVLHEMLTGRKLFEAEGAFAVMRAHVEAEPQPPGMLNPMVPPALDEIVKRAVAKDPAMRFRSADEFREALQNFAVGAGMSPERSHAFRTFQPTFLRLTPRLRRMRPSRKAILLALVPVVLEAGFCAIRFLPVAARGQVAEKTLRGAAVSKRDTVRSSPAVTASIEPQTPAVAASAAIEVPALPATIAEPAVIPYHRVHSRPKGMRRASQTEPNTPIQMSAGESHPATALAIPRQDAPQTAKAPELAVTNMNSVEAPETETAQEETPSTVARPTELTTSIQEVAPVTPHSAGNRFVRALDKMNPFRRRMKRDAAKAPLKQD